MEIKKDIQNKLMQRRELQFVIKSENNPSFAEVSKMAAEEFKVSEDQIMVENVKGKFGRETFLIILSIYDTKEIKDASFKRLIKSKKETVA